MRLEPVNGCARPWHEPEDTHLPDAEIQSAETCTDDRGARSLERGRDEREINGLLVALVD